MSQDIQVIVIGAGLSGLSASKVLKEHGVNVLTLEARDRVGGRTFTKKDPKVNYVDLGGSYVGPTQDRLLRMAKELGVENYKVNEVEDLLHYKNGRRQRFKPNDLPSRRNPFVNMDINNAFWLMDEMGKEIPAEAPWNAPHANEWDTMTYGSFVQQHCWTKEAREFLTAFITINITSEAYEASLLSFLWYIKQCGGTKRIFSTTNGGQERKFVGGSQQISDKIADILGESVLLEKPVCAVIQDEDKVEVRTVDGSVYKALYVIHATPPALQMKIHFTPPLPPVRNQLIQRMPMGTVMKCILYYSTTFWKSRGFCGSMLIEGGDEHPMFFILDDTKPDGSYPALIGFILADKLRRLVCRTADERKELLKRSIAAATGCAEALQPIHYEEKNWMDEEYSGGCYTAMYPPGFFTRYGRVLRKPIGRMYFAGTETATKWSGYMDGAIEAGERAAREVLLAMDKIPRTQVWLKELSSLDVVPQPFKVTLTEKLLPSVSGLLKFLCCSSIIAAGASVGAFYYHKCVRK